MPEKDDDKVIVLDDSTIIKSQKELDELLEEGKKQFEEEQAKRLKEKK